MAAWAAVAVPAAAQPERPRGGPFAGLFRGSPKDQPQTLDIRASTFIAWDDNVLAGAPGSGASDPLATDARFIKPGIANGFQGSLSYGFQKTGTRSQFSFLGDGSVQEFASGLDSGALWFEAYNLATNLRTKVTNKTSIVLGAGAAYAPYYQYAPFLKNTTNEESPVGSDYGYAVNTTWVRSVTGAVTLENRFSKKSSISAEVNIERRAIPGNDASSLDTRLARATFNHNLTRKLGFHLGYGIIEVRSPSKSDLEPFRAHVMDVGIGYGDGLTLALSRYTTLKLTIGASIVKNGDPVSVTTTGKSTQFVVDGSAILSRSIGRSWAASLAYLRGTAYVVGFFEPMMTDSANAGISGPLTKRLQFSTGAGASRATRIFTQGTGNLVSYTASTRLTFALFRNVGLYSQASYYKFSIPPGFDNFGFVPKLNRRSVSVGVTAWVPLIKQRRERLDPGDLTTGQQ
jgi:hypothetical protein